MAVALGSEVRVPDSNPGLVLTGVGSLNGLFHFSKTPLLRPVNSDNKYLCHRVGVSSREHNLGEALAEGLIRVVWVCQRGPERCWGGCRL